MSKGHILCCWWVIFTRCRETWGLHLKSLCDKVRFGNWKQIVVEDRRVITVNTSLTVVLLGGWLGKIGRADDSQIVDTFWQLSLVTGVTEKWYQFSFMERKLGFLFEGVKDPSEQLRKFYLDFSSSVSKLLLLQASEEIGASHNRRDSCLVVAGFRLPLT